MSLHCKLLRTVQGTQHMGKWEVWLGIRRRVIREGCSKEAVSSEMLKCNLVAIISTVVMDSSMKTQTCPMGSPLEGGSEAS